MWVTCTFVCACVRVCIFKSQKHWILEYFASGRSLTSNSKIQHLYIITVFICSCCTSLVYLFTQGYIAESAISDMKFGKQIRYLFMFPSCSSPQLGFVLSYFLPQLFSCCFARFTHWRRLQKHTRCLQSRSPEAEWMYLRGWPHDLHNDVNRRLHWAPRDPGHCFSLAWVDFSS